MSKSGRSQGKHKSTARQNAQRRAQDWAHLPQAPKIGVSMRRIAQERFPGETPLTGEDRPSNGRGHKQRGYEQEFQPSRARTAPIRTQVIRVSPMKRRPRREPIFEL